MSDERLTEAEWARKNARRECSQYGHDWQIVGTLAGPVSLVCARPCGDPGYKVERRDATTTDQRATGREREQG